VALTKENIIDNIYHQVGLSKSQSRTVAEGLLEIMKQTLEMGRPPDQWVRQVRSQRKVIKGGVEILRPVKIFS